MTAFYFGVRFKSRAYHLNHQFNHFFFSVRFKFFDLLRSSLFRRYERMYQLNKDFFSLPLSHTSAHEYMNAKTQHKVIEIPPYYFIEICFVSYHSVSTFTMIFTVHVWNVTLTQATINSLHQFIAPKHSSSLFDIILFFSYLLSKLIEVRIETLSSHRKPFQSPDILHKAI